MQEQYINTKLSGFSTLELLIALSLMIVIMTGAVVSVSSAQYWFLTAQISGEALSKNKALLAEVMKARAVDFQNVSSTAVFVSRDPDDLSDASCLAGGLCYSNELSIKDVSSCAKIVTATVLWRLGPRYGTSSISSETYVSNFDEMAAVGGDCQVSRPNGWWGSNAPQLGSQMIQVPRGITGMDALGDYTYVTSSLPPHLQIFKNGADAHTSPSLSGSSSGANIRLNDIDVVRDFSTGRLYAYVTQHSTTSQLAVYDVTDSANPVLITQRPLFNVASNGSFPQGWRVVAYGGQLFVVSRETTGPELHIFSLLNPQLPIEIHSAVINLNRTVNDMVIRDEVVGGVTRRFLYLAASSDLKEVGVYDVTGAVPIEITAVNLSGSADASSLYLSGNKLYVGRKNSTSPELYAFDVRQLIMGEVGLLASSEVGADVVALSSSMDVLYLGTGKSGAELQLWSNDISLWSTTIVNSGRISYLNSPRLAPLGIDMSGNNLYLVSQSLTQSETLSVLFTP